MNLSLSRKALILVAVPVLFEVTFTAITLHLFNKAEQARQAEAHARELALHLNSILSLHMQRVSYAFLAQHASDPLFANRVRRVQVDRQNEALSIDRLVAGHVEERTTWERMRFLFEKVENGLDEVVSYYKNDQRAFAAIRFASLQKEIDEIFTLGRNLAQREVKEKEDLHLILEQATKDVQNALQMSVFGSILVAFALALYFNKGTSSRLHTLMHNTERLSAGLAPDRSVTGKDELAAIDRTYHKMHESLVMLRKKERAVLDHAADAICSIDKEFRFSDANRATEKLWGFSVQELLGRRFVEIIEPADQERVHEQLRKCGISGEEVSFEARVLKADGTPAETLWVVTSSPDDGSVFCVIHDVTEERRIERLKSDFYAMVSHDLRTPLTSVQLNLSMLESDKDGSLSASMQTSVERAKNNISRLMALVNNLLDIDRLESGFLLILPCAETLCDLVDDALESLLSVARQKEIILENLVNEDVEVFADRQRITQVLINLLANALKFSPAHSKIVVSAQSEGERVLVEVKDQGRGVPAELVPTIFDRFKQAERDDANIEHGTGLGLAICKAIVERHGGKIGVEPNPDGGSVFWFSLPVSGDLQLEPR